MEIMKFDEHLSVNVPEGFTAEQTTDEKGQVNLAFHSGTEEDAKYSLRGAGKEAELEEEKRNLSGRFHMVVTGKLGDAQAMLWTVHYLLAVVLFEHERHCYLLTAHKMVRDRADLEAFAETAADFLNRALAGVTIDGEQAGAEAITGKQLLKLANVEEPVDEQTANAQEQARAAENFAQEHPDGQGFSVRAIYRDPVTGQMKRDLFWERAGADSGDPEAMVKLALAYLNGDGVEQSNEQAAEYMRKAAELDEPIAQFNLGLFYLQGCGVERDLAQAEHWLSLARDNGDTDAEPILQDIRCLPELREKAQAGDTDAQIELAKKLTTMKGEANLREALDWARKAAETGNLEAIWILGLAYAHGRGVEQNYEEAFRLYQQAAQAGHAPSQANLACLYARGDGVKKDMAKAEEWVRKSAEQGDPDGLRLLRNIDPEKAEELEHAAWEAKWRKQQQEEQQKRAEEWMKNYGQYLETSPRITVSGSKFVFSGIMEDNWPEILQKLTDMGGLERGAVSGKTDYLVVDPRGFGEAKVKEALAQRIKGKPVKIVLLSDFLKAIGMEKAGPAAEEARASAPSPAEKKAETETTAEQQQEEQRLQEQERLEKERQEKERLEQERREKELSEKAARDMLAQVDAALEKARKAGAAYEVSALRIEQTVSRTTINLSSESSLNSLRSIVKDCASACDKLYTAYQNLVSELDMQLRGLLSRKPSAEAIRAVAGTMTWLNEESRIQNNYAAQFDGIDLGQLVKKEYLPRPENLEIERFWRARYQELPEKGNAEALWQEKLKEHKRLASEAERQAKADERRAQQDTRNVIRSLAQEEKDKVDQASEKRKQEFQDQYELIRERMDYCSPARSLLFYQAYNYGYVGADGRPRTEYDANYIGCDTRKLHDLKQVICLSVGVIGLGRDGRCQLANISAEDQKRHGLGACRWWKNVKKLAGCNASNQVIGLLEDGSCVATTPSYDSGVDRVATWTGMVDVICEQYFGMGLRKDGTVLVSGTGKVAENLRKQVAGWKDVIAIFPYSSWGAAALCKDGTVLPDTAEFKEPALAAKNIVAVARDPEGPVYLQADGTVVVTDKCSGGWGGQKTEGRPVKELKNVVAIYPGPNNFAALCEDGYFRVYDRRGGRVEVLNQGEPIFHSYREYVEEIRRKERAEAEREAEQARLEEEKRRAAEEERRRAEEERRAETARKEEEKRRKEEERQRQKQEREQAIQAQRLEREQQKAAAAEQKSQPATGGGNRKTLLFTVIGVVAGILIGLLAAVLLLNGGKDREQPQAEPAAPVETVAPAEESAASGAALPAEPQELDAVVLDGDNMRPVFVDTDALTVRLNSFYYSNSETVYGLHFLLENRSEQTASVVLTDVVVDGFEISTSIGKCMVASGHSAICDSLIWQDWMDEAGVGNWTQLRGTVLVREDRFGQILYSIPVVIQRDCWELEKTYVDTSFETVPITQLDKVPEGMVVIDASNPAPILVDQDGVRVSINAFSTSNSGTYFKVNFLLDNQSEQEVGVALADVLINGYEMPVYQGKTTAAPGNKAICDCGFQEQDMEIAHMEGWVELTGRVLVRKDGYGEELFSIPVLIRKDVW